MFFPLHLPLTTLSSHVIHSELPTVLPNKTEQDICLTQHFSRLCSLPYFSLFRCPFWPSCHLWFLCRWLPHTNCLFISYFKNQQQQAVKLSLRWQCRHIGVTSTVPLILSFYSTRRWLSASSSGRLTPTVNPLNRRLGGPYSRSGCFGEKKILLP